MAYGLVLTNTATGWRAPRKSHRSRARHLLIPLRRPRLRTDFVAWLETSAPMNEADRATFVGGARQGYADLPALEVATAASGVRRTKLSFGGLPSATWRSHRLVAGPSQGAVRCAIYRQFRWISSKDICCSVHSDRERHPPGALRERSCESIGPGPSKRAHLFCRLCCRRSI